MTTGSNRTSDPGASEISADRVYTTGEAARLCHLSQQTIIRCFDSGRLLGFRVPGSRFRRIPGADLIRFIETNAIPALRTATANGSTSLRSRGGSGMPSKAASPQPPPRGSADRLLLITSDGQALAGVQQALRELPRSEFDLHTAATPFEAGLAIGSAAPQVVVLDADMPGLDTRAVLQSAGLRGKSSTPNGCGQRRVLVVGSGLRRDAEEELLSLGASSVHRKPLDSAALHRLLHGGCTR